MRIGILGTSIVGQTLSGKLVGLGHDVMVANADHTVFVCGNDAAAKTQVTDWLKNWFGWKDVIDLGDITNVRGTEMYLPIWLRLWDALGTGMFNVKIVK